MKKLLTRKEYHAKKGKKVYGLEDCPFCKKNDVEKIWEGEYWFVVRNISPYSGDEKHLMAIPFEHKKYSIELSKEELGELTEIHVFVREFYGKKNYFSCTRETMGNRSVEHIHMHFVPGILQGSYLRKMLENQGFPIEQELKV